MPKPPKASIIILSLGRPKCLEACLDSIEKQTYKEYEVILEQEKGNLTTLRNKAARRSRGEIIIFIDDDTVTQPQWLSSIIETFDSHWIIGGVSGPAIIDKKHKRNREIFRYPIAKAIYDKVFCNGQSHLPGHISPAGAWTTGASESDCVYEGRVQFLEACNMAFKRYIFEQVGGFDESYGGCGDWSEPDICFKIRNKGYVLQFNRSAVLHHNPSPSGPYKSMKSQAKTRFSNYELFSSRWVKPSFKHTLYKAFMRSYYTCKSL